MGVDVKVAEGSIRFSLGIATTDKEIECALEIVPKAVEKLREFS